MRSRGIYHPTDISQDFIRLDSFEVIFGGDSAFDPLRLMCRSLTFIFPQTNVVAVPWITGGLSLAGRFTNSPYSFNATFFIPTNDDDSLIAIYKWRNLVTNHRTGRIALKHEYYRQAEITISDVTTENVKYRFAAEGVWPSAISDVSLAVDQDGPMELSATFAADKIYMTYPSIA